MCCELNNREIARYSRQIIIPSFGLSSQLKLKSSKVLVVGAGGLGCPVSSNLAGAGINLIGVLDYDDVEITNLHRQLLHKESSIGQSKVESIKSFIKELNSDVNVVAHHVLLNSSNALDILSKYDIIVDATDNVATRYLLNDACVLLKKPLVSGAALQYEGQLTVYNYREGPCYRCIFPKPPPKETVNNCGDSGVLGAVTSVIGSLQAMEVIKVILNHEEVLTGKLVLYDALSCAFRTIKLRPRRKDCQACGESPAITENLLDYELFCGMAATDKDSGLNILGADERISVKDYENFKDDHILIDVRNANEFEICKLNNSINIPIKNILAGKIDDNIKHDIKEKEVFVVCRRGNDSQLAVQYLNENFKIKSRDLIGGLHEWTRTIDNNFPIY